MSKIIQDVADVHYGKSQYGVADQYGHYPIIGTGGVLGNSRVPLFKGPAVVVGRKGTLDKPLYVQGDFWAVDTTFAVIPKENIHAKWLYFSLCNSRLGLLNEATGVPSINRDRLYSVPVQDIDFSEQNLIAYVLDIIDETIVKTEAVIAKLKQVRAGMLHDLLSYGLDEHGQLRDPIAHPEQFKDSSLGRIPRDWDMMPLASLASVDRGKFTHRPRNDPAYYGGHNPFIQTGDIAQAAGDEIFESSQFLSDLGTTVSMEFPTRTIAVTIAANIGDTAILGRSMFFPDSVVGVIVNEPHSVRWVELSIRKAKKHLDALAPKSAQKNINLTFLRPLLIAVPNPIEQSQCSAVYEDITKTLKSEFSELEKLKSLKSGIQDDLLTGRVRVPETIMKGAGQI